METVHKKKKTLVRTILWCALLVPPFFIVDAVFSNPNRPILPFGEVLGAFVLPLASLAMGLLAYWENYRGLRSAAYKALAKRAIAFGIAGILLIPLLLYACLFIQQRMPHKAYAFYPAGSLRSINSAAYTYANAHPERGFPASMADMSDYLTKDLASGHKNGYHFTYTPRSTHHDGKLDAYDVIAEPEVPDPPGSRYFFTDETGVIYYSLSRDSAKIAL